MNWQTKKLGEVSEIRSGKNQKNVVNLNGKYPIYGSSGIFGYADSYISEANTTIIGRKGTINNPIYVTEKFWNVDTAFGLHSKEELNSKYLFYFCKSFNFHKLDKSTTIPSLSKTDLQSIEIPIPPLETQHAIVSKIEELFSELDKGIAELKTAQQQLKTYRQSVLKSAFEGKNKLPIGELFDFIGGGTPSKKIPNYWIGNIPWASVKDVKGDFLNDTIDRISLEGLQNSSANIAEKNDVILITRISPGKAIISNIKTAINQDLKIVKPKFKTTPKFIFYVFKSIEKECIEKSSGTTVLGINLVNLKEIRVPNLGMVEQNQIVQEIESRLSVADKMEQSILESLQKAEALRQSILKKAFSGELV